MSWSSHNARFRALVAACAVTLLSCATHDAGPLTYDFFQAPSPDDPWTAKISAWQTREGLTQPLAPQAVVAPGPTDLRSAYVRFRSEQKRAVARDLAGWIQARARDHYVPDGPTDHWATLAETLERDGDDCDGLELLSFNLLRDLGFDSREVYRAIVYRPADRQHHMVTLWFEDADDPWVIDPTGAMVSGMPRLSQVPGWVPLKVFSVSEEYTAARGSRDAAHIVSVQ
jgi:hypothetical protein